MKTIKILKNTACGGKYVQIGAVVEATAKDALYLIATGKAAEFEKPAPKAKKAPTNRMVDAQDIETRDAGE